MSKQRLLRGEVVLHVAVVVEVIVLQIREADNVKHNVVNALEAQSVRACFNNRCAKSFFQCLGKEALDDRGLSRSLIGTET